MSTAGINIFGHAVEEANRYLRIVMGELGSDDPHLALGVLRGSLHALRDRLEPHAAVHLGAQLPVILRGIYYEGWHPLAGGSRERHLSAFLDHASRALPPYLAGFPEEACRAAFSALSQCVDPGETLKYLRDLPTELRQLWPVEVQEALAA